MNKAYELRLYDTPLVSFTLQERAYGGFDAEILKVYDGVSALLTGCGGFRRGNVRGIDREIRCTLATVMSGITQSHFNGTTGCGIAEVVQVTNSESVSGTGVVAVRATAFLADAGTLFDLRFRQIVEVDNTLGRVGNVYTGTRHNGIIVN